MQWRWRIGSELMGRRETLTTYKTHLNELNPIHQLNATKVHVLHLLKKHRGSRRPSSWRQETITCSQEEAEAALGGRSVS